MIGSYVQPAYGDPYHDPPSRKPLEGSLPAICHTASDARAASFTDPIARATETNYLPCAMIIAPNSSQSVSLGVKG